MTELTFAGQIPDDDWTVMPGGCQMGGTRCVNPPEVEVHLPSTKDTRHLCREHVGYYMLGATSGAHVSRVLVRRIDLPRVS